MSVTSGIVSDDKLEACFNWAVYLVYETASIILGCTWFAFFFMFIGFAYYYLHYYNMGVRQKNKNYLLAYRDM